MGHWFSSDYSSGPRPDGPVPQRVAQTDGREKFHFLNAVPIQLLHDRWIGKYTERHVRALIDLKHSLETRDDQH